MNDSSKIQLVTDETGFYFEAETDHWFPIFEPSLTELWTLTTIGFLFSLVSLLVYMRIGYIIFRNKSGSFSNSSYLLVLHLAMPDCVYLFLQIIVGYPVPLIKFKNISHDFVAAIGFFIIVCSWVMSMIVFTIGINRYVAICHFTLYQKLFSKIRVNILCGLCWIFAVSLSIFYYACNCLYFKVGYAWKFSCVTFSCTHAVYYVSYPFWGLLTFSVPIIYFLIFFHYQWRKYKLARTLNRDSRIEKKDWIMLIQFIVISLLLLMNYVTFFLFVSVNSGLGNIISAAFSCLNTSINPYLYLACSSDIRKEILPKKFNTVSNLSSNGTSTITLQTSNSTTSTVRHVQTARHK